MNEELNKKLAKWVGFKEVKSKDCYAPQTEHGKAHPDSICHIEYPDIGICTEFPDFTDSLDACFKWLVPQLNNSELTSFHKSSLTPKYHFICGAITDGNTYWSYGETPALALCLAIERLIDGGKQNGEVTR